MTYELIYSVRGVHISVSGKATDLVALAAILDKETVSVTATVVKGDKSATVTLPNGFGLRQVVDGLLISLENEK